MNVFSCDGFLTALAEVNFPGQPHAIGHYRAAGRTFRLLRIGEASPLTDWPFLDFVEALSDAEAARAPTVARLPWLPHVALSAHAVEARPVLAPGLQPSPYLRWERFPDWAAVDAFINSRNKGLPNDSKRQLRRLERELGPVQFLLHDARPQVFSAVVQWKAQQYRSTGLRDLMAQPSNVALFSRLLEAGLLRVSSLQAGPTLLAAHFGLEHDGTLSSWVPAYDPAYQRYSPGRLLLEGMLRAGFAAKHREFDFLIGEESYKWHYATHNRLIGELGVTPLPLRLQRQAERTGKQLLGRYPQAFDAAKRLRQRLRS